MKIDELRPCDLCGKAVAGNTRGGKTIDFRAITVEHHLLNAPAINRHMGLAQMMGSHALAGVMGPNEDASVVASTETLLVCDSCMLEKELTDLVDAMERRSESKGATQ